ncbi:hypothetical protein [Klebsiella sp. BIGb0407]|uniref:hypothetical protein n=1 Tax=Klebsiella sp. BIGb0407 TaxID=2940603 RepID=UPI002167910B|nr:hypothetical protein [Klebsiella sp. BIGb0407]MCS3433286.1 hypothetical protein [Klebsiella sp. BIGb0407]
MPDKLINISEKSSSNIISPYIISSNHNNNTHDNLDGILLIKNSTINRESISHSISLPWSINKFLCKMKESFLKQPRSQPAVDIELDEILSQGRRLSQDSDTLQNLLKDKKDILSSSNLALTTKTGLVLGGILLSGAIVGGGTYYFQHTGRREYDDSRNPGDINLSPTSPYPPRTYSPFHSYPPDDIPSTLSGKQDVNHELFDSKFTWLITEEENQSKKIKRHNVPHPPDTEINPNKNKLLYVYSREQPEPCLTESFNQLCQGSHNNTYWGNRGHSIPYYKSFRIENNYCICPPPDGLEIITIAPSPSFIWLMNRSIMSQPTAENTTLTLFTPTAPTEIITTQLYNSQANTVTPKKSSGEQDPFTYEHERRNLALSETLRKISKILESPGAAILTTGKTALDQRPANNTLFYQTAKNVETAIDNILMWIPMANRVFITTNIVGDILNLYSDALENKEMDPDILTELVFQLTSLSKDIISSVITDDMKKISNVKNIADNKKFLHPFSFEKNNLMMMLAGAKNKVRVGRKFNHLYSQDTGEFIFYDHSYEHDERWSTDKYQLTDNIKNTFIEAAKTIQDPENISFFKNSSPPLYSNGIILRYNGELYLLINGVLHKAEEIPVKNGIYRYLIKNGDTYTPVTYGETSWIIEEGSSPLASQKLRVFLDNNPGVKNKLVSKNINHQDVSPLTSSFMLQFDKPSNKYLKINDQYYMMKTSMYGGNYIEGPHDLLELRYNDDNQYHIKKSPLEGICCFHKIPINPFKGTPSDPQFFLDKIVTDDISHIYSLPENQIKFDRTEVFKTMRDSKNIDGAIKINDVDYIFANEYFTEIHSNGDDTYILGDKKNDDKNVLVYKNQFGDTYFKMPKIRKKWQHLVEKPTHCITKRQPTGACAVEYYESYDVSRFLDENSRHSIIINDHQQQLELHNNLEAIYQEKQNSNNLYFKREDNTFFHARKDLSRTSALTPSRFIIYGKRANQQINPRNIIARICVVKDFDTKKIIFSTPDEAQDTIFNIQHRLSKLFLRMNEQDRIYKDINLEDLDKIKEKQSLFIDSPDLKELFYRSGKKILSSVEQAESVIRAQINDFLLPGSIDTLEINNLKNLEQSKAHPDIEKICNNAFKQSMNNIEKAIATMKDSDERLNHFITEQLGISDIIARKYFVSSLKNKLERIRFFFNEDNKKNIMVITKKEQADPNEKILSREGELNFGFTIEYDPLDRIFINTANIKDFSEKSLPQKGQSQPDKPLLPQPDSPTSNKLYFTNLISDTMIHESVHALGSPDDYLYLSINDDGFIYDIEESIKNIEKKIAGTITQEAEFKYFSKLYFMSNPLYKDFTFTSLNKPKIQGQLFRQDSFYRAIFLLKNPDIISLLIRELANPSQPKVQEKPTSSVKQSSSSATNK